MPLSFPDLDPARIVFEDADLIAIDKPEGVSCQAADPSEPDDLVARLQSFLLQRDGEAYVGTHQRLDRDTSGVILYTKSKRANPGLAKQMEGRETEKTYVAVVRGWKGGARRLEHELVRDGERMRVVSRSVPLPRARISGPGSGSRRGKLAITEVRPLETRGERTLCEIRIETGRTHQIRAQLEAVGASVSGDPIYGGEPAPRLMLHASQLKLRHPVSGEPLALRAPAPQSLLRHLAGGSDPYGPEALRDSLARALERRWRLAHREGTDAFRIVNEGGDALPGLAVDRYGEWLVVSDYGLEEALEPVLDALFALGARGLYVKRRPKQANVIVDARDESYSPSAPVRGEAAPDVLVVHEGGIPFEVRLAEGLSAGLFLDQRDNRRRVRQSAAGKRVLNLFAYTCAFGVVAARGGARETVNVDASARPLEWGKRNYDCAGIDPSSHRFVQADVLETLEALHRSGERFDLVCVDPPTYSRTKASRWSSGRDWERLAALALGVLAEAGALLACSNDRRMSQRSFRRTLHEAARSAGVSVARIRDLACPSDFPPAMGSEPHLKSLWLEGGSGRG